MCKKNGQFLQVYSKPSTPEKLKRIVHKNPHKSTFLDEISDFCTCVSKDEGKLIKTK